MIKWFRKAAKPKAAKPNGRPNNRPNNRRNNRRNALAYPARPSRGGTSNVARDGYRSGMRDAYLHKFARLVAMHEKAVAMLRAQAAALPAGSANRRQANANLGAARRFLNDTKEQYDLLRGTWRTWPYKVTADQRLAMRGAYRQLADALGTRYRARQARHPAPSVASNLSENAVVSRILNKQKRGAPLTNTENAVLGGFLQRVHENHNAGKPLTTLQHAVYNQEVRNAFDSMFLEAEPPARRVPTIANAFKNNSSSFKSARSTRSNSGSFKSTRSNGSFKSNATSARR